MSNGAMPPVQANPGPRPAAPPSQSEMVIDQLLRQTRRQLAGVEVADGLITLAVGMLVYLLVAAVLDHWLVSGGLGFGGRLLLFLVLVAATGGYFGVRVLPLLVKRIHPLFAAKTIEESRPAMKNSLVNFLFLRRQPEWIGRDALSRRVYQGVQQKAAAEVAQVDVTTAVDRAPAIHHGYVLVGVLAIGCLYLLLSPKSPLVSFGRVLLPWADVAAPTRVTIDEVRPGDAEAFQGDTLEVSANVQGLGQRESVLVYYTTADGQSVDQAVPMTVAEGRYRHECDLPPGGSGLQQDVTYYLAAGDCRSRRFSIEVGSALAIMVDEIRYDYPEYTGLADRTVRGAGDVRAIEGTRVSLRATSNRPIRQAVIEMDCDARRGRKMASDGTSATAQITLAMDRDDRARPQHESYQIRFSDLAGHENRRPIRHRIEVIPDRSPEIHLVDPPAESIELPLDGVLELGVWAEDPDFALRVVAFRAVREGRSLPIRPLLEKRRPEKAHEGPFEGSTRFEPARLGLAVGDKVQYWAEAYDNREDAKGPAPNRSETPRRQITIVAGDGRQAPKESPDGGGQPNERGPDGQPPPDKPDQAPPQGRDGSEQPDEPSPDGQEQKEPSEQGEPEQDGSMQEQPQPGENQQDQPGESGSEQGQSADQRGQPSDQEKPSEQPKGQGDQPGSQAGEQEPSQTGQGEGQQDEGAEPSREPIDGETNPGDAFEQVLKYRAEQEGEKPSESQQEGSPPPGGQSEPGDTPGEGPRQDQVGAPSTNPQPSDGQGPTTPGEAQGGKPSDDRESPGLDKPADDSRQPGAGSEQPAEGVGQEAQAQQMPDNEQAGPPSGQSPKEPEAGEGTQSKGAGEPLEQERPGAAEEKPDAGGGDPSGAQGDGRGEQPSPQSKGSPAPQEGNQPRDKTGGKPDQNPSDQDSQSQSPSISPKQSDSEGDTSGDRSGGGEEGGGQKSPQPGTGTAGTNTAAEQGGSRSSQPGEGETGTEAGDQMKADRPTGQSALEEQGPGSATRGKPGGQGSGEKPEGQQKATGEGESSPADQPGLGDAQALDPNAKSPSASGNPVMGGAPGEQTPQPSSPQEQEPLGGEDINLDYARQQTELALEYLEEQLAREEPDRELLDRLGWSRDDLDAFVRRWEAMRRAAGRQGDQGEKAGQELDEALKSLGLQPRSSRVRGGQTEQDSMRRLNDSRRFDPPAKWKELFEAYTRSISSPRE